MWLLTEVPVPGSPVDTSASLALYTLCARADGSPNVACVGRKAREPAPSAGNVILENQSISRVHAEVRCHAQQKEESVQRLELVDQSKFGTFINGSQVAKGASVTLKNGDEVRFGTIAKGATFRAQWSPVFLLCSSVSSSVKSGLRKLCPAVGGHMLKAWDKRVTHLVQDKIVMTEKAMLALIDGVPIVTAEFFEAILGRKEAITPLPNPQAFLPEVSQGTTQSVTREDFEVNLARKTMLKGHLFFFFTEKQHAKHASVITHASGEAIVLRSRSPHSLDPVQAEFDRRGAARPSADKVFFIDVETTSQLSQSFSTDEAEGVAAVRQRCAEHGVRKVRDTEVLQAILRGQVIAELAEDTLSQPMPADIERPDDQTTQAAQAATGTKRSVAEGTEQPERQREAEKDREDTERPVPAASRKRTRATPAHSGRDTEKGRDSDNTRDREDVALPVAEVRKPGESPAERHGETRRETDACSGDSDRGRTSAAHRDRETAREELDNELVERIENAPSVSPAAAAVSAFCLSLSLSRARAPACLSLRACVRDCA